MPMRSSAVIRRKCGRAAVNPTASRRAACIAMPAQKSIAKIAMNLPSASAYVASHTAPAVPVRLPYTVGLARAATGIANIGLGGPVTYTIGYSTAIVNGAGADLGVVTARFSSDPFTLTINGTSIVFPASAAVNSGVSAAYFYNGSGPFTAQLFVTSIDLSAFGVASGGSVSSIAITGNTELDLIRVAGFGAGATAVPEPESYALMLAGMSVMGWLGARRRKS